MSKEAWFREFERIQAEYPEMSDEKASEQAFEDLTDKFADAVDRAKDEKKEQGI